MTDALPHGLPVPDRVFVTGANGFIGRTVAERFRAAGVGVGGMDLTADPARGVVAGDTTRPGAWQHEMAGADVVVHTAAIVSNVASLADAWTVNVLGTRKVLETARDAGVGRVVHLSSIAAYGHDFPDGVDETYPVRVTGASYVDTKVNGEQVVLAAHAAGEVDTTIVRPGDVYGPASRPWVILPLQMLARRQLVLPAGGRGIFTPVYIDDLVQGVVRAATHPDAAGHVFNVTSGTGVTCADYFGRLARLRGVDKVPTLPAGVAVPLAALVGRVSRAVGVHNEASVATMGMLLRHGTYAIDKARDMLGYAPQVDLDEGMRRVGRWLQAQDELPA